MNALVQPEPPRPHAGEDQRAATRPVASAVRVTTLRLPEPLHARLELLHSALKKPLNKLINEAVDEYVERRTSELERDLGQTLDRIKLARLRDARHTLAIEAHADAESVLGENDPAEGRVVRAAVGGSAHAMVHGLLKSG